RPSDQRQAVLGCGRRHTEFSEDRTVALQDQGAAVNQRAIKVEDDQPHVALLPRIQNLAEMRADRLRDCKRSNIQAWAVTWGVCNAWRLGDNLLRKHGQSSTTTARFRGMGHGRRSEA